jgi:hypothetical protein
MAVDYDVSVATSNLLPVDFPTPPQNPFNTGLYAAVGEWQPDPDLRFMNGVRVRGSNYGGENAFGVWGGGWCGEVITVTSSGVDTWSISVDGVAASGIAHDATADTVRTDLTGLSSLSGETVGVTSPSAGVWVLTFTKRHDVQITGTSIASQTETKFGSRPDILEPFDPITVWAYDECDLTEASQEEIIARAAQILRLEESVGVEREFAARLLLDAADLPGPAQTVSTLRLAVGYLEAQMALTNTLGFFHVGAQWAAAEPLGIFNRQGTRWVSPLGHVWVIGGGYVDGLDDTIIATSQPYGWRDEPAVRTAIDTVHKDVFAAIAERTVLVGYEHLIAAVTIT